ncbi:MAG: RNA polymerase sigma factor [bacterium]
MEKNDQIIKKDEEYLIQQCKKGDNRAYSRFFNSYKEIMYRLAYKFLGPVNDLEDVVQVIFIQIFKSLPGFEGRSKLTTWIYKIGVNVCIQYLRNNKQKKEINFSDNYFISELNGDRLKQDAHTILEQKELQKSVYNAINRLNLKKRSVIILHDMEGKTIEEIAQIIQKPVGTVKSRLFHAREELKNKLKPLMVMYR